MHILKYNITNKLLKNVATIEAAKEVIVNAPLIPSWERNFQEEALVRTIHFSTQIEGNELSLAEAKQVLDSHEMPLENRDIREVINYREAMDYISRNFQRNPMKITQEILLDIHGIITMKLIPSSQSGNFRKVNVKVINTLTGEIGLIPPDFNEVPQLIQDLINWLNSDEGESAAAVIKAGILHYSIAAIHPFTEGNGRTARAMATLSLFKDGYDIKSFFCLDEFYAEDAKRYYEALHKTDEHGGDVTLWLEYFSE